MEKDIGNISGLIKRARIYGLSEKKLRKIIVRDKTCLYCHKKMKRYVSTIGTPSDKATIEHFSNKAQPGESVNVGMCCGSCNSSRSDSGLSKWFKSKYCIERDINEKTIAKPVRDYFNKYEKIKKIKD